LEHLAQGVRTVEELSARAHLTFANTSRHLQILRRTRLIETERRGKHVLYRLAGETEVVALIKALGRVGERNVAEIGRVVIDYFQARDALGPVSRDDLVARLRDDLITVLDVRPEDCAGVPTRSPVREPRQVEAVATPRELLAFHIDGVREVVILLRPRRSLCSSCGRAAFRIWLSSVDQCDRTRPGPR